jgi:hypothetical protein
LNWILLIPFVSFAVLAIIGFAGWIHAEMRGHRAYWEMEQDLNDARRERGKLNTRNDEFAALNADLHEALDEARKQIAALNMNTVEVQAPAPKPVKRTSKKEATQ